MTTPLQYFMLIAKEKSIVRAAEQLYITPQNLSNHMRRLEKEYGVLFDRYPHFRLTPAGEALLETLKQISILEQGLDERLKEMREEMIGNLHFGIHPIRAYTMLPLVLPAFYHDFPNVHVTVHHQNMARNVEMLLSGELDAFFGVDTPALPEFRIHPLSTEKTYFVASAELLEQNGIAPDTDTLASDVLPHFPYLLSPADSIFRPKINTFCEERGILLRERLTISDFSLQLVSASQGLGACFTPGTMLLRVEELNRDLPPEKKLRALKVEGLHGITRLSFVTHRMAYRSQPVTGLLKAFQAAVVSGTETAKEVLNASAGE